MRTTTTLRAFTLIELLVVIAILGILAAIALPNLKEFGRGDRMSAASSQLLGDLAFARQRAIADHTTIYVIFVPPINYLPPNTPAQLNNALPGDGQEAVNRLVRGQQVSYALFSFRSVGDQPGRGTARYRTEWKTLPQGIFIPAWKYNPNPFAAPTTILKNDGNPWFNVSPFTYRIAPGGFPYPAVSTNSVRLPFPYVAFDYRGRLITYNQTFGSPDFGAEQLAANDVFIPLAQGSVNVGRAGEQKLNWQVADALENPAGNATNTPNVIQINKLTGRARVLRETL